MKKLIAFLCLAVGLVAQPTTPLANTRFSGTNNVVLDAASLKFGTTTPGSISGANGALTIAGAGTDQNITLTPSGTGTTTTPKFTVSTLTSGRVPFLTTGGLFTDSASLTFNSGTGALTATSFNGNVVGGAISGTTGTFSSLVTGSALGGLSGSGAGQGAFITSSANVWVYGSENVSGTFPFDGAGHLVLQSRSTGSREIVFVTGTTPAVRGRISDTGLNNTVIGATTRANGSFDVLSKNSGTFDIPHPIKPETHRLVHSFIEGPYADLIYRGTAKLVNGAVAVNIDSHFGLTAGTFMALATNPQVWIQNEDGWAPVRGMVIDGVLTITAKDAVSDTVSWLVIAERHDEHIRNTSWTDKNGRPILEPEVAVDYAETKKQGKRVLKALDPAAAPSQNEHPR